MRFVTVCVLRRRHRYKIGVNDTFGESGPAVELLKKYELDSEGIYKKVKAFVEA